MGKYKCFICEQEFNDGGVYFNDLEILTCHHCNAAIRSCVTCIHRSTCNAGSNPDNISPYISTTLPNGQSIQTNNPEYQKHYCSKEKCSCCNENDLCGRKLNYCENWEFNENTSDYVRR